MRRSYRVFGLVILAFAIPASVCCADGPLEVSDNGRFLVDDDGTPFFWLGDTNWRLYKLDEDDIEDYLDDRDSKKFNVIQGPLILPSNAGDQFVNASGESNTNPGNPNDDWFEHIDFIVDAAKDRDMYVALVVTWGDNWNGFDSNSQAKNFGEWLGERYKNDDNVIWIVAGEYIIEGTGSQIVSRWNSLGKGLAQGSDGNNLITAHGSFQQNRQSSSVKLHGKDWLDFNMVHSSQGGNDGSGAANWALIKTDWNKSPTKPTIDGEATYEHLGGWDDFGVRRRAYWSVFAGAFGHTYGAASVWESHRPEIDVSDLGSSDSWIEALDYPGAFDMKHLRFLMESRPMLKRKPAQDMIVGSAGGVPNHVQATRDGEGRYAMIYVPQADEDVTVDMDKISGNSAVAWWFNPRNGDATEIGTYSTSGTRTFTTPSNGPDWVLVLDDESEDFPEPGEGGPLP
jgi:hypothetical protein